MIWIKPAGHVSHATDRSSRPRKAQPPIFGGFTTRRPGRASNSIGRATSAIRLRDAAAPAQKCGPAPKAMSSQCNTSHMRTTPER